MPRPRKPTPPPDKKPARSRAPKPLAPTGPAPLLVVARRAFAMEQLDALGADPRIELFTTRELSREWIGFADRVAAILMATNDDPWDALVYAASAAVTAPIVIVMPAAMKHEKKELIAGGAAGCLLLPIDKDDVDHLVQVLVPRAGQSVVNAQLRLLLDPVGSVVRFRDKSVHLTHREFAMLHFLSAHAGKPVPTQKVFEYVWGGGDKAPEGNSQQVVAVWAYELRRKLKQLGLDEALVNVRGFGYSLQPVEDKPKRGRGRPRKEPPAQAAG